MLDPRHLKTFAAICETGSFEQAATRVHVTPSAVSQRMRALSEAAGGALFARLHPAEPTLLGRRLWRHAQEAAALDAALMADLGRVGGAAPVTVALPADVLATWGIGALAEAAGLRFTVRIDDQDHSAELLRRGEVSAAVSAERGPLPGCDAYVLAPMRYRAVCAPDFAARWFPDGPTEAALAAAPSLRFNAKDTLQLQWIAALGLSADPPVHTIGATDAFREATLLGMGWGLNPEALVARDLAAGRLVEVAPSPLDVPLWWQVARSASDLLAPLTERLRRASRA